MSFLLFTIMQVPYMAVRNTTVAGAPSMILLSPLQITAATFADRWPQVTPYAENVLGPGAWVREAVTPLLRCKFVSRGGPCERELSNLWDMQRVKRRVQLPTLVKVVTSPDFRADDALSAGAALVTISAALAPIVTVKSAIFGFLIFAYGIVMGAHTPLPPGVLVAFLCAYAGFGLGEGREKRQLETEARRRQAREERAKAAAELQKQATPSKGKAKAVKRRA